MESKEKKLLLVGPPLAGKTKVGKALVSNRGFYPIMTKELLRKNGGVDEIIAAGDVAPDSIMTSLLEEHIFASGRVFIDSLRSAAQIKWLRWRAPHARLYTVHFSVDESTLRERAKNAGNTERGVRVDDDKFDTRLEKYKVYYPEMLPVLREQTVFEEVDASQPFEVVLKQVLRFCDRHGMGKEITSAPNGLSHSFAG